MTHTTLISTDTLAAHLDGSWVIVDCRYDLRNESWGREQYLAAHIPGAVYASLSRDLSGQRTGANGRHPLPCVEDLEATFGRLGISSDTQVVMYDQDAGMYASRMWWMLRYMGHDAAAVLDGGWAKWMREQRPVRSGDEIRTARGLHGASPEGAARAWWIDVQAAARRLVSAAGGRARARAVRRRKRTAGPDAPATFPAR